MAAVATLGVEVKANGVKATADDLDRFAVNAGKADVNAGKLAETTKKTTASATNLSGALGKVASMLGVALSVVAIKNAADSWSDLNSRVSLAVGSVEKGAAVMRQLNDVAKSTYSDINATTESFIANAGVLRQLGKSTQDAVNYTEALNNAFVVSGAKGDRAAMVQRALSKAMASGTLRGDELNTVIENGGRVAELLAEELGVSTLQLRKMGADGKITGDVLYNAMVKNMVLLREEAESMPATMGDAGTAIANLFTMVVGTVDQMTGATGGMAQAVYDGAYGLMQYATDIGKFFVAAQMIIGQAVDAVSAAFTTINDWLVSIAGEANVSGAAMALGIGLATTAALGLAAALMGPVLSALAAVSAAILLNPIGLMVAAFASAVAAAFIFRDELSKIFGTDIIEAARSSANTIIGAFVAAYKIIVNHFENLPAVFAAIGARAWNALVSQFEGEALGVEIMGTKYSLIGGLDLSGLKKEVKGVTAEISKDIESIWNTETTTDWVGKVQAGLGEVWSDADAVAKKFAEIGADQDLSGDGGGGGGGALNLPSAGAGGGGGAKGGGGGRDHTGRDMEKRLEQLKSSLAGENEARLQAYVKDMETLKWYLDNKKMTEDEYNQWKKRVEGEAFEKSLTDQELLTLQHQQELEALQLFFDQKKLTEEEYLRWQEEINTQHAEKMRALTINQWTGALDSMGELMGAMASMQSSGNEKMLKAQRIFAAASALVSTFEGAAKALTLPFPANLAAVATVIAKGMSLVAAIKSGSKSASGGGSAGGTTATAAPPPTKPQQMAEIKIHGEVFGRDQVIDLVEKINDVQKDGHMINWSYA